MLSEGTQLAGGFVIVSLIGRGGFGEVYLAYQQSMQRQVAIKTLQPERMRSETDVVRFQREALAAGRLSHPNIVHVYDVVHDEQADLWFIVMQYVPAAMTLLRHMQDEGPMNLAETERIVAGVAAALDAAHRAQILHRDVKPANVLLDAGWPLLTDFGIARLGTAARITSGGETLGTLDYMSPEQAMAADDLGPATDQYALAAMTYEMLTGRTPFTGTDTEILAQLLYSSPPPLQQFRPDIPMPVADVVMRAMDKDPANRFPQCGVFATAFRAAMDATATGSDRRSDAPSASPRREQPSGYRVVSGARGEPELSPAAREASTVRMRRQRFAWKKLGVAVAALIVLMGGLFAVRGAIDARPQEPLAAPALEATSAPGAVNPSGSPARPRPPGSVVPANGSVSPVIPARLVVANAQGQGAAIRRTPNLQDNLRTWPNGTELTSLGPVTRVGNLDWYEVRDPAGNQGWIPARAVRVSP